MVKTHFTRSKYISAIFVVLAICVLYVVSRFNYLLFHSTVDIITVFIAACVFIIIWNTRHLVDSNYLLYVGITFLFFAFLDCIHLLGYKGMGVFPQYGTNLATSLYIASRYMLSISLLLAPLFINRKLNTTLIFAVYSLVTLLILLSIFFWQIFPVCFLDGVGLTPFKVISDYIICLVLLGAIGLLLINRRSFDSKVIWVLVSSLILSIATGLAFTLYTDPYGMMNMVGHLFQIASFYLFYLAIIKTSLIKPEDILFQKLKQSEEALAIKVQELKCANAELEKQRYYLDALVDERTVELTKSYESIKQEMAERKRTEESLQESEAKFRNVFDFSVDAIGVSKAGVHIFFNPAYLSLFGYTQSEELVGKPILNVIATSEHQKALDSIVSRAKSEPNSSYYETRGLRKDGSEFDMDVHTSVYEINGERFILVILRDITERKQSERVLKTSEEKYRALVENINDVLFTLDTQGVITYISPVVERISKYKVSDVMGKSFSSFIYSDDLPGLLGSFNRLLSGQLEPWEFRIVDKDGRLIYVRTFGRPIYQDGQNVGFTSLMSDITKHKQAEYMQMKNQKRIRMLLGLFQLTQPVEEQIIASAMEEIIDLTDSQLGFIGFVDELETIMFAHLWSEKAMQSCGIEGNPVQFSLKEGGLWTAAIRQRQPIIINDYLQPDPRKKGYPAGHVLLNRFMGIPIIQNGHVVMVAGLANKAGDYDETDLQQASLFLEGAWVVIKRKRTEEALLKSYEYLKKTLHDVINTIVKIVETRDPYTAGHQHRVADLAVAIGIEMKLDDIRVEDLRTAAIIHDIGKMYVPSDILSKPGRLSDVELSLIKIHPQAGYDIVKDMDLPCSIAKAILQHHERLDGSGYPNQRKGDDIILEAKILAVADAVEAMSSHRPYRSALGIDKALEEISNGSGKLYDPDVVDACLVLFKSCKFEFTPA